MPIDPNIALSVQGVGTMANPMQVFAQAQQMRLAREQALGLQQERLASAANLQQQAADRQRVAQQNATIDQIMRTAYTPDPDTGAMLLDPNRMQQELVQNNLGHLWPQMSESIDKMNTSAMALNTQRRQTMAANLWALQQAPDEIKPQAAHTVLAGALSNQLITRDHVQQALQMLGPNPTAADVDRVVQQLGGAMPEFQKLLHEEQGRQAGLAETGAKTFQAVAAGGASAAEAAKTQNIVAGMKGGMTAAEAADVKIKQQTANAESLKADIARKTFNATYGANLDAQGNPLTPDALKLAAQNDPQASMLATYQLPPVSSRMEADPKYAGLMARIHALNPDYDATQFANRSRTRQAFTTGTQGQQVNAMNTAMQHLDLLADAATALQNGSFTPGNALYNKVATAFGGPAPQSFDQIKHYLDGEIGNMVKKGAVTDKEMADQGATGGSTGSPQQIQTYLNNAIRITASKFNSLHYQAAQALGDRDPLVQSLLMPEAKAVLAKHGVNPDGSSMTPASAPGGPPPPGKIRVRGPNGPDGKPQTGLADDGKPLPPGWVKVG